MRKLKITPLLLLSAGLVLWGLYQLIFVNLGNEGWATLGAIAAVVMGVAVLGVYAILRTILKTKVWRQVVIETVAIGVLLYCWYKRTGQLEFQLPHNYRGYIVVVYGVENAPKLNTHFYSNKIKLRVPASGIVLTSDTRGNYYSDWPIFLDSTLGEIHKLAIPLKRNALSLSLGTLVCGKKNHVYTLWVIKDEASWSSFQDSLNPSGRKLTEACSMIKE